MEEAQTTNSTGVLIIPNLRHTRQVLCGSERPIPD